MLYIVEFIEGEFPHDDLQFVFLCWSVFILLTFVHFSQESCAWKVTRRTKLSRKNFSNSGSSFLSLSLSFFFCYTHPKLLCFFFTSEPLRCCCCVARSPLPTLPTLPFIYLSRPLTDRPHPQNPPTYMHLCSIHSVPCVRACCHARLIDNWSPWLTLAGYIADKVWRRRRETQEEEQSVRVY